MFFAKAFRKGVFLHVLSTGPPRERRRGAVALFLWRISAFSCVSSRFYFLSKRSEEKKINAPEKNKSCAREKKKTAIKKLIVIHKVLLVLRNLGEDFFTRDLFLTAFPFKTHPPRTAFPPVLINRLIFAQSLLPRFALNMVRFPNVFLFFCIFCSLCCSQT